MATRKATQEVVIELSNGVKGVFSGRAIAWPGQSEGVSVVGVKFFAPKVKEKKAETPTEPPKPPVPPVPTSQSAGAQTPAPPSK